MEQYKFRGQRLDTKEWVFGYYVGNQNINTIIYDDLKGNSCETKVIPETVGQYTEIKDKNEIEVYEDDIIKYANQYYLIKYENGCFWITQRGYAMELHTILGQEFEVVGKIYDNPELLEEE